MPFVNIYVDATQGSISVHNLSLYSDRECLMLYFRLLAEKTSTADAIAKLPDVDFNFDTARAIWDLGLPKLFNISSPTFDDPLVVFKRPPNWISSYFLTRTTSSRCT